jgi:cell division protein FtsA
MSHRPEEIIVAVDVGTSKICAVVGRRTDHGVDVIGFGMNESRGLRTGEVVAMEQTAQCLANAIEEAELMAGVPIGSVYMGVSAGHIRGRSSSGSTTVLGATVTDADVEAAKSAAEVGRVDSGRVLLHTLVREYVVDQRDGITKPVGMAGAELEARVHLVTASEGAIGNLTRCATMCGLELKGVVHDTLAASEAVLTETEREMGCVVVDIGGGTTDVAIWNDGALSHSVVIPYGGDALTSDVGIAFRVPRDTAERLKRHHGSAVTERVEQTDTFVVPGVGGRPTQSVSRRLLATVLEPRLEEILRLVKREVELSGYQDTIRAGYVLTGGGAALNGAMVLAERTLEAPVRLGIPLGVGGMVDVVRHAKYGAAVGLLKYAAREEASGVFKVDQRSMVSRLKEGLHDLFRRML